MAQDNPYDRQAATPVNGCFDAAGFDHCLILYSDHESVVHELADHAGTRFPATWSRSTARPTRFAGECSCGLRLYTFCNRVVTCTARRCGRKTEVT